MLGIRLNLMLVEMFWRHLKTSAYIGVDFKGLFHGYTNSKFYGPDGYDNLVGLPVATCTQDI